jgi:hypothetical protein
MNAYNRHVGWKPATTNRSMAVLIEIALCALVSRPLGQSDPAWSTNAATENC